MSKNRKYFAVSGRMLGDDCPQLSIYTIKGGAAREKERTFRYTESKSDVRDWEKFFIESYICRFLRICVLVKIQDFWLC